MSLIKKIAFLSILGTLISCNQEKIQSLEEEVKLLKSKNDSLQSIVSEINNKYIFDSISIVNKPIHENNYKLGSDYRMNITISAFNKSDFFIKYDTIINDKMINADTLEFKNGTYEYKNVLDKDEKIIKIKMLTGNKKYGEYKQGILYDKIQVKN
ncbi:hypothetical protein [Aquimarina sp. AU58]|uniref:hypothetical protein n=1 Tax=Aquimarina sp. AU58 TaxID=1874112 RepID=UPI000D64CF65|nr:hypothetical protein [Aquimarina sp. AU58]